MAFKRKKGTEGFKNNPSVPYLKSGDHLRGGFADTLPDDDDAAFSPQELLAWSAVHGLASLFIDGPIARQQDKSEKMQMAANMLKAVQPSLAG